MVESRESRESRELNNALDMSLDSLDELEVGLAEVFRILSELRAKDPKILTQYRENGIELVSGVSKTAIELLLSRLSKDIEQWDREIRIFSE